MKKEHVGKRSRRVRVRQVIEVEGEEGPVMQFLRKRGPEQSFGPGWEAKVIETTTDELRRYRGNGR